jgi:hypothetical protein
LGEVVKVGARRWISERAAADFGGAREIEVGMEWRRWDLGELG